MPDPLDEALDQYGARQSATETDTERETKAQQRDAWMRGFDTLAKTLPAAFHPLVEKLTALGHKTGITMEKGELLTIKATFGFQASPAARTSPAYVLTLEPRAKDRVVRVSEGTDNSFPAENVPLERLSAPELVKQAEAGVIRALETKR
jgi:hypothetical protein